jgi:histidyl-tRNA synthetase
MTKEIRFCSSVGEIPSLPGAYVIAIELADPVAVTLLGQAAIELPAGRYLYCGSAKGPGGLKARLSRHFRRGKSVRWHIDQLTERGSIVGTWIFLGGDECELVRRFSQLPIPIPGFGSCDCAKCCSHLLQWSNGTALPLHDANVIDDEREWLCVAIGSHRVRVDATRIGLMRHESSVMEDW